MIIAQFVNKVMDFNICMYPFIKLCIIVFSTPFTLLPLQPVHSMYIGNNTYISFEVVIAKRIKNSKFWEMLPV